MKLTGPFLPTLSSGREKVSDMEVAEALIPFCENAYYNWFGDDRWGYAVLPDFACPGSTSYWYYITLTSQSLDLFSVTPPPKVQHLLDIAGAYARAAGATRYATLLLHCVNQSSALVLRLQSENSGKIKAIWHEIDNEIHFEGITHL
jgi:hypothetical protein